MFLPDDYPMVRLPAYVAQLHVPVLMLLLLHSLGAGAGVGVGVGTR
jgi:hypothetical protein